MSTKVSSFTNFLFGNVDEKGELEDGDLDSEIRNSLSQLGANGTRIFNVTENFGITEDDVVQSADSHINMGKEVLYDEIKESSLQNIDWSKKAQSAVDFRDIKELADESSDTGGENGNQKKTSTTIKTESKTDAENKANGASSPNNKSSSSSSETDEDAIDLRRISPAVHTLLVEPHKLNGAKSVTSLPPDIRLVCSSMNGTGGPILKFSEIFAPKPPLDAFRPRKKQKTEPLRIDIEEAESDQEELFERYLEPVERTRSEKGTSVSSKTEEASLIGLPMKEDSQVGSSQFASPPPSLFSLIELQSWEDKITWSPKEGAEKKEAASVTQPNEVKTETVINPNPRKLWGEFETPKVNTETVKKEKDVPVPVNVPVPAPAVNGNGASASDDKKKKKPSKLSTAYVNIELENVEWEKSIIWDDEVPPEVPPPTELILDLSDKFMTSNESQLTPIAPLPKPRGRKRKLDTLDEGLDKFNISNDKYYRPTRGKKKQNKAKILHSEAALELKLVKTHLNDEDLANFHRPKLKLTSEQRAQIYVAPKEKESDMLSQRELMKKKSDLSGKDGRLILMEYGAEERPLVVMNVGMGTKMRNYYRKKNATENPFLSFDDGENSFLSPTDNSPFFLGDVKPGTTVQALDNNLFVAPVFKHVVPETDFLVVKNGDKYYIREVNAVYCVGQEQPKMEVPAPNSRAHNTYIKNRLQALISRIFMKKTAPKLTIQKVMNLFPGNSETGIRKRLKDCADFERGGADSGNWIVKDESKLLSEEDLRQLVTPEMVALYESMLEGIYTLKNAGIEQFTSPSSAVTAAIMQLENEATSERTKRIAHSILEELQLTPWNLSSNFVAATQGKAVLQLVGVGDPSNGRGEGFSYVKMPQKNTTVGKKKKDNTPKAAVTGTDADLRKLSLDNARLILLRFGVPDEEIQRLGRWERIALVRNKSSEAAASGEAGHASKFARGFRYSLHQQQAQHQEQTQMIFENQIRALSDPNPEFSDDEELPEDEEEDFEDFGKDLESMLDTDSKKRKRAEVDAEEEAEAEEYKKFKEEVLEMKEDESSEKQDNNGTVSAPQKYLKITRKRKMPDGSTKEFVQTITDPREIEEYLRKNKEREKKYKAGIARRMKPNLTPAEEEERHKMRREKRKLQEQLRKLRKNKEKQEQYKQQLLSGNTEVDNSNANFRCGACGLPGHMKTNRSCPLYIEETNEPTSPRDDIKVDGLKVTLKPQIKQEPGAPLVLKIKKDSLPLSEEEVLSKPQQRRRRTTRSSGAVVELSNKLEKVLQRLKTFKFSAPFQQPVATNDKFAVGYYDIVKNPMCLSMMREKVKSFKYNSRWEFLSDLKLIVDNCYLYNQNRNPHLLPMVDQLYSTALQFFDEMDAEIAQLEKVIQEKGDEVPGTPRTPATPFSPLNSSGVWNTSALATSQEFERPNTPSFNSANIGGTKTVLKEEEDYNEEIEIV